MDLMQWTEIHCGPTVSAGSASNAHSNSSNPNQYSAYFADHHPPAHHHHHHLNAAPTIKNHSVTHFGGYLYCFGGYDGRRNHMTLLIYSIAEQRWIRPVMATNGTALASNNNNNGSSPRVGPNQFHSHNNSINNMTNAAVDDPFGSPNNDHNNSNNLGPMMQDVPFPAAPQQANPNHQNNGPNHNLHLNGGDTLMDYGNNANNNDPNLLPDYNNSNNTIHNQNQQHLHEQLLASNSSTIIVTGTPPPGRNGHSATLIPDDDDEQDPESGRIIVLGGWLGTGPLAASDMHVLDISRGGRHLRWYQPAILGVPPGPCNMHSADYVKSQRTVYVFRGGNGREYLNDLHALDVDTMFWKKVKTTGAIPQQRANHSSAVLDEELFIFGGWNGTERLNDIHILDTRTKTWTCPHVGGVLPHPRAGMTLTALRGRLYLFGGSGTSAKCFQDLQILDREKMAWLDVSTEQEMQTMSSSGGNAGGRYEEHPQHYYGGGAGHNGFEQDGTGYPNHFEVGGTQQGEEDRYNAGSNPIDWRHRARQAQASISNPNDEDSVPSVLVQGLGPGRRAGHTATAVNRKIYVFGGSCGSDYLNDFFLLDTDPPPQAVVNKSNSLELMERRLGHFFNDEEFADVVFLVQGQRVYGHKMVLSIVSDCFRAMFSAGFREASSHYTEITIPDCSHSAFLTVMEYIYTGKLPKGLLDTTAGAETSPLSANPSSADDDASSLSQQQTRNTMIDSRQLSRLVELLELADRFFLDHLKQVCETRLGGGVSDETVEYLSAVAQKTNATQLMDICGHYLRNQE